MEETSPKQLLLSKGPLKWEKVKAGREAKESDEKGKEKKGDKKKKAHMIESTALTLLPDFTFSMFYKKISFDLDMIRDF